MKFIVMQTPRYEKDAKKQCCTKVFERVRNEIKVGYDINKNKYANFPGNYLKKKVRNNLRCLFAAHEYNLPGEKICCILALCILPRGDKNYERFIDANLDSETRDRITGLNEVKWDEDIKEKILDALAKNDITTESSLQPMSALEQAYIESNQGISQKIFETPIYESKEWVDTVQKDFEDENFAFNVCQSLYDKILDVETGSKDEVGFFSIPVQKAEHQNKSMIFCAKLTKHQGTEIQAGWFLLGIGNEKQEADFRQKYPLNAGQNTFDRFVSQCRRAYPISMLDTDTQVFFAWLKMEKDRYSNFILSDEEISILSNTQTFPLFITGRAGSGKSTMLQYLFAEYFLRFISCNKGQEKTILPPIYLSYSSKLVENAKMLAKSLFTKNHVYTTHMRDKEISFLNDIEPCFEKSFSVFDELVRYCITSNCPDEIKRNEIMRRFSSEKHVTFSKFSDLWNEKFGRDPQMVKEIGPALSWHIIRTYIKGWDPEALCEPEDYKEIGGDNRSVTDAVYQKVFDRVWTKWYEKKQEEDKLWDDQDLVRYCLAPDDDSCVTYASEKFSAIFCDEAQDFTRAEIEFILKISLFSHRRIYNATTVYRLPFVFVGDELQTINPTGFSWASLRSYFTERLTYATEVGEHVRMPEPQVLSKNYRSATPIVKLANRIQLLREAKCPDGNGRPPQVPYYDEHNSSPIYCFSPHNEMVWKKLRDIGVTLIIPSADGQSPKEYINSTTKKDDAIRKCVEFYDTGAPKDITILNPTQAKGLEYSTVAIYGFEEDRLKLRELLKWLDTLNNNTDDKNEANEISLKYFLSKVYVSVTRAKVKLFILTEFNENSFWAFAFSQRNQEMQDDIKKIENGLLGRVNGRKSWDGACENGNLGYLEQGGIDDISLEETTIERVKAEDLEEQGKNIHDVGLMMQAAARYQERDRDEKSINVSRCKAYAYEYEGKYAMAANCFLGAKMFKEAVFSLWKTFSSQQGIDTLLRKVHSFREKMDTDFLETEIAKCYINRKIEFRDFKLKLNDLLQRCKKKDIDGEHVFETRETWRNAFCEMLKIIDTNEIQKDDVIGILNLCNDLKDHEINLLTNDNLPKIAFKSALYEQAISLWDGISQKEKDHSSEYYQAKSFVCAYPDKIKYLKQGFKTDWEEKVVQAYHDNKNECTSGDLSTLRILDEALISKGCDEEFQKSFPHLLNNLDRDLDAERIVDLAKSRNSQIDKNIFMNIFYLKTGKNVKIAKENVKQRNQNGSLKHLSEIISDVKDIRSKDFREKLNKSIKTQGNNSKEIKSFMENKIGKRRCGKFVPLLLAEIGSVMEKRGYFIDAARYYEWAEDFANDTRTKRDMAIRWVFCKEKQSETSEGSRAIEIRQEAIQKRNEIHLLDEIIPDTPAFNHDRWQWLFDEVLKTNLGQDAKIETPFIATDNLPLQSGLNLESTTDSPNVLKEPIEKTLEKGIEPEKTTSTTEEPNSQTSPILKTKVKYDLCGYQFLFTPATSSIRIEFKSDEDTTLTAKIEGGKFRSSDFVLEDGHLLQEESNVATPFDLEILDNEVIFTIVETHVKLCFPVNK